MADEVQIIARVVPDGVRSEDGKRLLRVSLALVPDLRGIAGGAPIDIENWPAKLFELRTKLKLFAAKQPSQRPTELIWLTRDGKQGAQDGPQAQEFNKQRADAANVLWRRIFLAHCGAEKQFTALKEALKEPKSDTELMKVDKGAAKAVVGDPFAYPVAPLARGVEALYGAQLVASLVAVAGAHPIDGKREPWDAARPIISPRFFDALNNNFGIFAPDTHTNRLVTGAKLDYRWNVASSDNRAKVKAIGQALEAAGRPKLGDKGLPEAPEAKKNYVSPDFIRSLDLHLSAELSFNLRTAQHALDVSTSIGLAVGGGAKINVSAAPHKPAFPYAGLDVHFGRMAIDPTQWMRGYFGPRPQDATLSPLERQEARSAEDELRRAVAAYHASWRPDVEGGVVGPQTTEQTRIEAARRKFLAILMRPSLAKFLGLIIDIEIMDDDALRTLGDRFCMFADFGDGQPDARRVWTATMLVRKSGIPHFFGPCPQPDFANFVGVKTVDGEGLRLSYQQGVLDLAATGSDGDPRFALIDFDVDAAVQALENTGHSRTTARQKGALDEDIRGVLPNLRTRGIALIDRDRTKQIVEEIANASVTRQATAKVLYAEDLVVGYRIDVGLCAGDDPGVPPKERWRSITDRLVQYDLNDVPKKYDAWLGADADRENGFVKPLTRVVKDADRTERFCAQETLAVWTGGSLAVGTGDRPPSIAERRKDEHGKMESEEELARRVWQNPAERLFPVTEVDGYDELGMNLGFALPKTAPGAGLPPLRFCRRYWMGARLVYVNGGGISLDSAAGNQYSRKGGDGKPGTTAVGGRQSGSGLLFKRGERAGAPVLLLATDDPLVTTKPSELRGERVETAVLRGASAQRQRQVVPPRTTFDVAEAHGEFDGTQFQRPPGAFNRYARDPASGEFPNVRKSTPSNSNPGQVLRTGSSSDAMPYYPDPLARECRLRVLQHETGTGFDKVETLHFYASEDDGIINARPVTLEFHAFTPKQGDPLHNVVSPTGRHPSTIRIYLGEAADLDLLLWSATSNSTCLEAHGPIAYGWDVLTRVAPLLKARMDPAAPAGHESETAVALAAVIDLLSDPKKKNDSVDKQAASLMAGLLSALQGPAPTVNDQRRLRVVRPVRKPLQAPRIAKVDVVCRRPDGQTVTRKRVNALVPVRVLPPRLPDGTGEQPSGGWVDYVADQEEIHDTVTDPNQQLCFESQAGASQTFFVGTARVHRASTGKVRFEAVWTEFPDAVVLKDDGFHHQPSRGGPAVFAVEKFSRDDGRGLSDLDLLRDEAGALRGLKIDFPDTKARRLTFRLYGVSRFTEFYPPPTASPKRGDPRAEDFELTDSKYDLELWVPSTARPAPPVVDRILPVFRWDTDRSKDRIVVTREVDLRIYLKRPWHSSGEGESLGVICWPPNLFGDGTADDVARCTLLDRDAPNVINPKEEFLTRWGADPVHLSGDLSDLIPADQFKSADRQDGDLLLSLPHRDNDLPGGTPKLDIDKGCPNDPPDPRRARRGRASGDEGVRVAIASYVPTLDRQRGDAWYCDVPIRPGESYFPFVRLGLARYQPHSLKDFELSYPVAEWAQIPPRREAVIEFIDKRTILVVVKGIGYHQSQGDEIPEQRDFIDRPRLRIRVCRAVSDSGIPHQGDEINYVPVIVAGKPLDFRRLVPDLNGNTVTWMQKIMLPRTNAEMRYAVILEEFEVMVADGTDEEHPGREVLTAERGPMFACTIPFLAPHVPGTVPKGGASGAEDKELASST